MQDPLLEDKLYLSIRDVLKSESFQDAFDVAYEEFGESIMSETSRSKVSFEIGMAYALTRMCSDYIK